MQILNFFPVWDPVGTGYNVGFNNICSYINFHLTHTGPIEDSCYTLINLTACKHFCSRFKSVGNFPNNDELHHSNLLSQMVFFSWRCNQTMTKQRIPTLFLLLSLVPESTETRTKTPSQCTITIQQLLKFQESNSTWFWTSFSHNIYTTPPVPTALPPCRTQHVRPRVTAPTEVIH